MVRYALAAEDKEARREVILAAARTLFLRAPEKLPSAAAIATEAGLAKGTLYLYFETKEEIFMDILHVSRMAMTSVIREVFALDDRSPTERIDTFLTNYVADIVAHPEISKLESLGYSVLERNVAQERLRAYRGALSDAVLGAGETIEASLGLGAGEGARVLVHTYALTRGLWQSLDIPADCAEMMGEVGAAFAAMDYADELTVSLRRYWNGLGIR